jgi:adenylate cyclase
VLRHHLQAALTTLSQRLVQVQVRIEPEDTHQSRVALRQIRTLLKLLIAAGFPDPAQRLLPQCAELADALGSLRDLDVVMDTLIAPLLARLPKDPALKALATAVAQYREALRRSLRQQLAEREIPLLICALGLLSEEIPDAPVSSSSEEFAQSEARRLRKKIRRREQLCRSEPSVEADHRLRLAHKALRYASPLLQDLNAPQDLKAWAKASAKAQETLGLAQDRATARNTITSALQASPMDTAMQARALAMIEGFLLAQQ